MPKKQTELFKYSVSTVNNIQCGFTAEDDNLRLRNCYVPCECGQDLSIETRVKEHSHAKKSAVAEHSTNLGHRIQLQDNSILSTKFRYMDRIIREATEIELHPDNMITKDGLSLSRSWKPLVHSLKGRRKPPIQKQCLSCLVARPEPMSLSGQ
jgi:hypothetical protein